MHPQSSTGVPGPQSTLAPEEVLFYNITPFRLVPHIPWSLPERVGSRFACLGSSVSCFLDYGHLDQAATYFDSTQHVMCLLTSNALMMENPCKHASYGLQWFGLKQTYRGYPLRVVRYVLFTYIIHSTNLYYIYYLYFLRWITVTSLVTDSPSKQFLRKFSMGICWLEKSTLAINSISFSKADWMETKYE